MIEPGSVFVRRFAGSFAARVHVSSPTGGETGIAKGVLT